MKVEMSETREPLQLQKDMQILLTTQNNQQVDDIKQESIVKLPIKPSGKGLGSFNCRSTTTERTYQMLTNSTVQEGSCLARQSTPFKD